MKGELSVKLDIIGIHSYIAELYSHKTRGTPRIDGTSNDYFEFWEFENEQINAIIK